MAFGILFRDKNLLAENIKKGVKILKVTGTCEGGRPINNQDIAADSSIALQAFTAGEGYDGIGVFTLRPYSKENRTVDSSTSVQVITPETADCIWTVLVNPYILDSKTVDSSTVSQTVVSSADGLGSVTVNPYTLDSKTVDSSTVQQVVTSSADGLSSVTVNPYILDSKTVDASTSQITVNSSADGLSSVTVNPYVLDSKTVDSSTVQQVITSSEDGLSSVTVNPYTLDSKSLDPSTVSQTVNSSADGLSSVSVSAVTSSIDSNIQAGNIKNGVTILGVTGNLASGDWVANARKNIVDISNKTLTGGTHAYSCANLFYNWKTTSSTRTLPQISGTQCLDHEFCKTFYSPGRVALNNYTIPFTEIGGYGMDHFLSYVNIDVNNYNNTVLFPNLTTLGDYGLCEAFFGNGGIRWASMPNLETVGNHGLDSTFKGHNFGYGKSAQPDFISSIKKIKSYGMQYCFDGCSYLNYGISFDNLDKGNDPNGTENALYGCFKGTGITSITFPKLEWTNGAYYFMGICENCTSLTSVSFPEFYMENSAQVFRKAFKGCTSLTSVSFPKYREVRYGNTFTDAFPNNAISFNVHPGAVTRTDQGNIVYGLSAVTTITLSEDATVDIHLDWQPSLSFSTVYGILSRLDLNTSGKSCTFYTGGLTVTDDALGSVQAIYDAAVNAGWTINNLTITAP